MAPRSIAIIVSFISDSLMPFGKLLIGLGLLLLLAGLIINYAPWLINWFGKLPGDIHIERKNSTVFFPITSMLVISIILTLIINLFFHK